MTSFPEAMGGEFGDFEKELVEIRLWAGQSSWGIDCRRCTRQLVCLPQWQTVEVEVDHGVLQISTDRDLKGYRLRSAFVRSASTVSIVKIVSLTSCRKTKVKKSLNSVYRASVPCTGCNIKFFSMLKPSRIPTHT